MAENKSALHTRISLDRGRCKRSRVRPRSIMSSYNGTNDINKQFYPFNDHNLPKDTPFQYCVKIILRVIAKVYFGLRIYGGENLDICKNSGCITVLNHVNPMDCTFVSILFFRRKVIFTTIQANIDLPFIGRLVTLLGGAPLPDTVRGHEEFNAEMASELKSGAIIHFYPEGNLIPYNKTLQPFMRGPFIYAARTNAPLIPMVLTYRKPGGIMKLYRRRPCFDLNILPPQFPDAALSVNDAAVALLSECKKDMQNAIDDRMINKVL